MGGGSTYEARQARQDELDRQKRISTGTKDIRAKFASAFDEPYYDNLQKAAKGFYEPQLTRQYDDALKQLQFALARTGNLSSSAAAETVAKAGGERDIALQDIAERGKALSNERRGNVLNAENVVLSQLQSSADPAAAAAQTAAQTAALTKAPAYEPLGQVFTDLTGTLATQAQLERAGQNRYNLPGGGVTGWGNKARSYFNVGG